MAATPSHTHTHSDAAHLADLVDGIRIAMLTTPDGAGTLSGRPLTVQRVDRDGTIWFLVDRAAEWVAPSFDHVNVAFVDGDTWVSARGRATLVQDQAVLDDLGDPVSSAWFGEGTTPVAVRVDVDEADYWSAPGKLAQLAHLGKAVVTQEPPDLGERGVVET